ncbi:MAG TPA: creatininase family protein [Acholeplasmataceae bacterium]|nr:creatininase family protein [Acholeplasmataceae bacterium]
MNWEKLTSVEFAEAVKKTDVCIIAFGVLERHGDHLPLGTDYLNGHKIASMAAEIEAAVVFPPFYFGQIYEAKCFPGTITLKPTLLMDVIQGVLDEIGRNGFKKIILYNAHGGNVYLLKYICQAQLDSKKPYQLYYYQKDLSEEYKSVCETSIHGHACECETSVTLANHPELVKMDKIDKETTYSKKRLTHLSGLFSGLSWYANYPEHYVGNANYATIEKGKKLVDYEVQALAKFIKSVKDDQVLHELSNDFFNRVEKVTKGE